jgi:hypothetical protein
MASRRHAKFWMVGGLVVAHTVAAAATFIWWAVGGATVPAPDGNLETLGAYGTVPPCALTERSGRRITRGDLHGLAEVRRVPRPQGRLRMLEHVRSPVRWRAWLQDLIQPVWTRAAGGCRPNRDTEAAVERAGFRIEAAGRRARGSNRLSSARAGGASP